MDFKKEIREILKKEIRGRVELETPKNPEFGDYSFPCFDLAEKFRESPVDTAKRVAQKLKKPNTIDRIEVKGPYINFFINKHALNESIIKKIIKEKERYGKKSRKDKIIIEHTSINPNASPHLGRARNALIGDSLVRIFRFLGYKVKVRYWVNDVGKQVAILVFGSNGKNLSFSKLFGLYIRINEAIKKNPSLERNILELLNKYERGDKKTMALFRKIVNICLKGQIKILKKLGIRYDIFDYESKYLWKEKMHKILNKLEKTGRLFIDEDGRKVLNQKEFNFAMKNPVLVLTRSDGTSLYPLRDIVYTIDKLKKGKNIIVLGEDQKLYFEQIKGALKLLGYKAPGVVHYSFVLLKDGKMSTRKGNVVLLEDFMKEVVVKANEEIYKRHNRRNNKLAMVIGYGAIKYSILKVGNDKNVIFDWSRALDFEGDSGPYLQYAYVRAKSILKRVKPRGRVDYKLLNTAEEFNLIKGLAKFPDIILKAKDSLEPYIIANYTYELAKLFNEFYYKCQCISAEKHLRNARLSLVLAFTYVIKNSLNLLGIGVPEKM